ncbi:FGFR1 oncogene partner isoform X12 [Anguilla anguilla]|uniref:FGFR1 oncogene partner isoform X12 n=1 Tax=Anguilla anguilla TaxID=7936 RepID=UPI0015A93918|nr:FGFR1 oncogene partner isoform X12 [Anguilla anguilla]
MSAAEEDTELRDLLIQNLENNGVLNKIKAELRAAVFLALEEQDKVENKTPLVNESLKKCLNTKDGRLVASLITDFLQVFNLDFTLAVFQPEINSLNGLESREAVARELGVTEQEGNRGTPLLLELVKRSRHKDRASVFSEGERTVPIPKELSPRQIADARRKFDFYDKDKSGGISKDELRTLFSDLFPAFHKNMLERYLTDEFRAVDKDFSNSIEFQEFLGMYKRLFIQCRSVVCSDVTDIIPTSNKFSEENICTSPSSKKDEEIPRFKGFLKHSEEEEDEEEKAGAKGVEVSHGDASLTFGSTKGKGPAQASSREPKHGEAPPLPRKSADAEVEEDEDEGDSFFDDPLPRPKKTFGCNLAKADKSHSEASLSENNNSRKERADPGRPAGSPPPPPREGPRLKSGEPHPRDPPERRTGNHKDKGSRDSKAVNSRDAALGSDEDNDYDDDFNSTSHRSDNSRSELSIGEEIEEVSIEGPDGSDKLDDLTQDLSVSQLSQGADYMEEVA